MFSEDRKEVLIETIVHKYTTFNIYDIKNLKNIHSLNKGEVCALNDAKLIILSAFCRRIDTLS